MPLLERFLNNVHVNVVNISVMHGDRDVQFSSNLLSNPNYFLLKCHYDSCISLPHLLCPLN